MQPASVQASTHSVSVPSQDRFVPTGGFRNPYRIPKPKDPLERGSLHVSDDATKTLLERADATPYRTTPYHLWIRNTFSIPWAAVVDLDLAADATKVRIVFDDVLVGEQFEAVLRPRGAFKTQKKATAEFYEHLRYLHEAALTPEAFFGPELGGSRYVSFRCEKCDDREPALHFTRWHYSIGLVVAHAEKTRDDRHWLCDRHARQQSYCAAGGIAARGYWGIPSVLTGPYHAFRNAALFLQRFPGRYAEAFALWLVGTLPGFVVFGVFLALLFWHR